jgi:hypothetical protein
MGNSKNILNTTSTYRGRPDKRTLFNVLIIIVTSFCVSLYVSYQKLGWTIFLEGVFGLIHIVVSSFAEFSSKLDLDFF